MPDPPVSATEGLGILLVMRAFASGATVMTGIEAISNAVPAFKPVEWRNARTTLTWMIGVLVTLFAGIIALVHFDGILPRSDETVLSQLAHSNYGSGPMYVYTQAATAAVLLITAGITKFTQGAWVALVAVGLFLVVTTRIRRHYDTVAAALRLQRHAIELPRRTIAPRVAAPAEGVEGSPDLPELRDTPDRPGPSDSSDSSDSPGPPGPPDGREVRDPEAFRESGEAEGAEETEEVPEEIRHLSLVPIETLDRAGTRALAYAASLEQPVLVVHVSTDVREAETFREHWQLWGDHLPLQELVSPYRAVIAPLVNYIEALHHQRPDLTLTVILPEVVMRQRRYSALHGRTAPRLRAGRCVPCARSSSLRCHFTSEGGLICFWHEQKGGGRQRGGRGLRHDRWRLRR